MVTVVEHNRWIRDVDNEPTDDWVFDPNDERLSAICHELENVLAGAHADHDEGNPVELLTKSICRVRPACLRENGEYTYKRTVHARKNLQKALDEAGRSLTKELERREKAEFDVKSEAAKASEALTSAGQIKKDLSDAKAECERDLRRLEWKLGAELGAELEKRKELEKALEEENNRVTTLKAQRIADRKGYDEEFDEQRKRYELELQAVKMRAEEGRIAAADDLESEKDRAKEELEKVKDTHIRQLMEMQNEKRVEVEAEQAVTENQRVAHEEALENQRQRRVVDLKRAEEQHALDYEEAESRNRNVIRETKATYEQALMASTQDLQELRTSHQETVLGIRENYSAIEKARVKEEEEKAKSQAHSLQLSRDIHDAEMQTLKKEITELRTKHAEAMGVQVKDHDMELGGLKKLMENLKVKHAERVAAMTKDYESEIVDYRDALDKKSTELRVGVERSTKEVDEMEAAQQQTTERMTKHYELGAASWKRNVEDQIQKHGATVERLANGHGAEVEEYKKEAREAARKHQDLLTRLREEYSEEIGQVVKRFEEAKGTDSAEFEVQRRTMAERLNRKEFELHEIKNEYESYRKSTGVDRSDLQRRYEEEINRIKGDLARERTAHRADVDAVIKETREVTNAAREKYNQEIKGLSCEIGALNRKLTDSKQLGLQKDEQIRSLDDCLFVSRAETAEVASTKARLETSSTVLQRQIESLQSQLWTDAQASYKLQRSTVERTRVQIELAREQRREVEERLKSHESSTARTRALYEERLRALQKEKEDVEVKAREAEGKTIEAQAKYREAEGNLGQVRIELAVAISNARDADSRVIASEARVTEARAQISEVEGEAKIKISEAEANATAAHNRVAELEGNAAHSQLIIDKLMKINEWQAQTLEANVEGNTRKRPSDSAGNVGKRRKQFRPLNPPNPPIAG